ncbi:carboxypeptidase regulatory-like domain-containing protein [Cystobacter fuscus]|uniref:carboxypeptidase regulatory-like domain-containing protein n=1 Tax=Cystobacter fuscus TaxID=43 RepID=UPI0037C020C3
MKHHFPSLTHRSPNASASPLQLLLIALALLVLPGSAWAEQVVISGQVRFADGTVVSSASIYARPTSSDNSLSASADAAGNYSMYLPPGTYDLLVQYSVPGYSGTQLVAQARSITTSTQLNLTVKDILLSGRILNSSGQPVAGVMLSGYGYFTEGTSYLTPTSGSDGRFQIRILPGAYASMRLSPPSGTPYAVTPLPDQTFSASVSRDYVLANAAIVSGQVKFADGTVVSSASIYARLTSSSESLYVGVDSAGNYSVPLAPGTYDFVVQYSVPGYSGTQLVAQARSITTSTQLNLTVKDILFSGRILNSSGQPVAGVQLSGYGYFTEGTSYLVPTSGSDGRFQIRILPGAYASMRLNPPSGTSYAVTNLPNETFSASVSRDYVLANAAIVSGQVKFADGTVVSSASIYARPTSSGESLYVGVDSAGNYSVPLAPGTYDFVVQYSVPGYSGTQLVAQARSITTSTQLNLTVKDILLSGRILNSSGQPVAGVQLSGYGYFTEGTSYLVPTSGSDGRFQIRILPGTYASMRLSPSSAAGYLQTWLPDETFSGSTSRQYVIDDLNECLVNNGGCSANASCTNFPGSRTCTCNAGYTGDGLTCQAASGRILVNEILANEPGSSTAGEFVELVNVGGSSIDISGWTISDETAVRHTFAAGTVLAPGTARVVFGGASGIPSGVTNAVASSTGTLNLANTTDTVTVKNAAGATIDTFTYPSSLAGADGVSMNRSPDASAGVGFVLHNSLSTLTSSPGKRANGSAF